MEVPKSHVNSNAHSETPKKWYPRTCQLERVCAPPHACYIFWSVWRGSFPVVSWGFKAWVIFWSSSLNVVNALKRCGDRNVKYGSWQQFRCNVMNEAKMNPSHATASRLLLQVSARESFQCQAETWCESSSDWWYWVLGAQFENFHRCFDWFGHWLHFIVSLWLAQKNFPGNTIERPSSCMH